MDLGNKLLKYRKINNYTQKQVADFLEISQSTYCDWESNTIFPKTENIIKIAKLYDLDLNEIFDNDNKVNVINSPNSINNSPNSKIEIPEAIMKVAEGLDKLILLIEKMIDNKM